MRTTKVATAMLTLCWRAAAVIWELVVAAGAIEAEAGDLGFDPEGRAMAVSPLFSGAAPIRAESRSRLRRLRSPRNSAAVWQRRSRSFSRSLSMTSCSLGGRAGLIWVGGAGLRSRMPLKITASVAGKGQAAGG